MLRLNMNFAERHLSGGIIRQKTQVEPLKLKKIKLVDKEAPDLKVGLINIKKVIKGRRLQRGVHD